MKNLIYFPLICFLMIACNPEKKYAKELAELASINQKLDSIIDLSKTIDYDSLFYMRNQSAEIEGFVKKNYSADTINQDFANKMSYVRRVNKSLKNLEINKMSIEKESVALKKQFVNLSNDTKNGRFNAAQIEQYLAEEKAAFAKFELSFKSVYLNQNEQKSNFYYAMPKVSEYIELIKIDSNQN